MKNIKPEIYAQLLDITAKINSSGNVQALLGIIMEAGRRMMQAEASSLFLLDDSGKNLIIAIPTGPQKAVLTGREISINEGIAGWVARHKQPVISNNAQQDERFLPDLDSEDFTTRQIVSVPMLNDKGEVIGVLEAINRKTEGGFPESDIPALMLFANQSAIAIEKEKLHKQALEKNRLEEQLALAKDIQQRFLPKESLQLQGVEASGISKPADEVGGDYFDYYQLNNNSQLALAIADVAGKGYPAALLMATVRASIRSHAENRLHAIDTVRLLHQMLEKDTDYDSFTTLFYAIYDFVSGNLEYVNAGHNPPMLFRGSTDEILRLNEGGPILGGLSESVFRNNIINMKKGDMLILFSDGITEAENSEGDFFDEERLKDVVIQYRDASSEQLCEKIMQAAVTFSDGYRQSDDQTVMVFKVK